MAAISNDPEHRKPARTLSEEEKAELIERLGGAEALKQSFADFRAVTNRFRRDEKVLIEQYPHKWAIVGKDGLIAAVDSLEEAGNFARANGLKNPHFVIEYLDPDPPLLVL